MRLTKDISDRLWALIEPVVTETNLELVDIVLRQDRNRSILDIVIDKNVGITVDDCAVISEKVSLLLDVEDLFQHKYYLEVGSPGIFRELKKDRDFLRNLGKRIKANFKTPQKGHKEFIGLLRSYTEQVVVLGDEASELEVERTHIKKIQLYPDL
ncbi:MAG: ribosome maturation factor RimP [Proteobacteria bacterium]|nr:ribosome maturation factor RimP [Pseudomonadota bacterium]